MSLVVTIPLPLNLLQRLVDYLAHFVDRLNDAFLGLVKISFAVNGDLEGLV